MSEPHERLRYTNLVYLETLVTIGNVRNLVVSLTRQPVRLMWQSLIKYRVSEDKT